MELHPFHESEEATVADVRTMKYVRVVQHGECRDAKRPDVRTIGAHSVLLVCYASYHLRRSVLHRARSDAHRAGDKDARPEIYELAPVLRRVHSHVVGFHINVGKPVVMQVTQCGRHVPEYVVTVLSYRFPVHVNQSYPGIFEHDTSKRFVCICKRRRTSQ